LSGAGDGELANVHARYSLSRKRLIETKIPKFYVEKVVPSARKI
jgi:hypothetical protein